MATPKQLPSGSWRVKAYDYTDGQGKKHYVSFTAPTKKEAAFMKAEFDMKKKRMNAGDLTVGEAIDRYIDAKSQTLSPSTIRAYRSQRRSYYEEIEHLKIKKLNDATIQYWINTIAAEKTPKTVRNAHGLLVAALQMSNPDMIIRVTLPKKKKPELYVPSDAEVKHIIDEASDPELRCAIMLAAFGPMRRGEICALTWKDIEGNIVNVSKALVLDSQNVWQVKQPKTYGSYRRIEMPEAVIDDLRRLRHDNDKDTDLVFKCTPGTLSDRYNSLMERLNVPRFRFHDLRHYSASIMHAIGIPDQYIMQRGGWTSDGIMKTVYRNTIDNETKRIDEIINSHFDDMI